MKKFLYPILFIVSLIIASNAGMIYQVYAATLPQGSAVFQTSLLTAISASDVSMTLVANSLRGGSVLSGFNCVTMDEGSASAEYVCGTISGTAVTAMVRGIDPQTGTSSVASLKFAHRRGSSIKITDFPLLQILRNQINGSETIANLIQYAVGTNCSGASANTAICPKAYMDALAVGSAVSANETTQGFVQGATALQQASSTAVGSTGSFLFVQAKYASSSPVVGCAVGYTAIFGAGCVPVAGLDGKINPNYIATSSAYNYVWAGSHVFTATSTFAYYFGDGYDGASTTVSGTTTLSRDMYYTNLTINSGAAIDPAGFKIYVSGTLLNNGYINSYGNSGGAGGNGGVGGNGSGGGGGAGGTAGTAGVGGVAIAGGTLGGVAAGTVGQTRTGATGGNLQSVGGSAAGIAGVTQAITSCIGSASANASGVTGGNGGTGGTGSGAGFGVGGTGAGAVGGVAGTCSSFTRLFVYPNWSNMYEFATTTITAYTTSPPSGTSGGGGGGGGGGGNTGAGGGGGGSGGSGGGGTSGRIIAIYASILTNNGTILSRGGNGGNGGNSNGGGLGFNDGGGGGGGASGSGGNGGNGGVLVLVYRTLGATGIIATTGGSAGTGATFLSTGGAGAGAGTAGANGAAGVAGTAGATGIAYQIDLP